MKTIAALIFLCLASCARPPQYCIDEGNLVSAGSAHGVAVTTGGQKTFTGPIQCMHTDIVGSPVIELVCGTSQDHVGIGIPDKSRPLSAIASGQTVGATVTFLAWNDGTRAHRAGGVGYIDVTITPQGPVSATEGRDLLVRGLNCEEIRNGGDTVAFNGLILHTVPGE